MQHTRLKGALGLTVLVALAVSGLAPYDRATWWLEVSPVLIAAPLLLATARRFPLTNLLYVLITLHCLVLILGGAYTYARVPAGFWVQELLELERNPYDKLGHFMQGFVPALIAREILLRGGFVAPGKMLAFLALCVAMTISAVYELIEWWVALIAGGGAVDFLGTQGDPWDTQWDMFLAGCGAIAAQFLLERVHDAQLVQVDPAVSDKYP